MQRVGTFLFGFAFLMLLAGCEGRGMKSLVGEWWYETDTSSYAQSDSYEDENHINCLKYGQCNPTLDSDQETLPVPARSSSPYAGTRSR